MSTDIGLNPPGTRHDRVVGGVAVVAGIKFGDVVISDTTPGAGHRDVKLTAVAGDKPVAGICVAQTDPTTGSAIGDNIEICDTGICEVNLAAGETILKGDVLVTAAVNGQVKKLGAEVTYDIVGRAFQAATSGASPIRISVELSAPFATK